MARALELGSEKRWCKLQACGSSSTILRESRFCAPVLLMFFILKIIVSKDLIFYSVNE
jgi:hypothetical protein